MYECHRCLITKLIYMYIYTVQLTDYYYYDVHNIYYTLYYYIYLYGVKRRHRDLIIIIYNWSRRVYTRNVLRMNKTQTSKIEGKKTSRVYRKYL